MRLCALASVDKETFGFHLAQPENVNALIIAITDEEAEIREIAVTLLAKLCLINPAYVQPILRKQLIRVSAVNRYEYHTHMHTH